MAVFITIMFWTGIVSLVDGSVGLLFLEKWQRLAGRVDIHRIAWVRVGCGLLFKFGANLAAIYIVGKLHLLGSGNLTT